MDSNIRNFVIIAHIDHGKSTLADRMLEMTGTIEKRLMKPQYLDQLELERERGITIKMAPVRMKYYQEILNKESLEIRNSKLEIANSKQGFVLNLIDTPGHSDFGYEVSRALTAVEGAILLVDATQGIQAQTLANFENAKKAGLVIIGAVNKIDVASKEQVEAATGDIANLLGVEKQNIIGVSGKTGEGVLGLLERVVGDVPPPKKFDNAAGAARGLIFDSYYDEHKGIIAHVRIFDGKLTTNQDVRLVATNSGFKIKELGYFSPELKVAAELNEGMVGYIATGIKDPDKLKIGDTILSNFQFQISNFQTLALPGYKEPQPVVFVSIYPEDASEYDEFKRALGKLRLSDAALTVEPDYSEVLGRGFKTGFLGRLHFEITAERLKREFNIETVHSFPSVAYRVKDESGWKIITNPKDFPRDYLQAEEPVTEVEILTKPQYLGNILRLADIFRFSQLETETLGNNILIKAKLPLSDLIRDLDDKLKSASEGFASLNYRLAGYENAEVGKLEILVAGNIVAGLTRVLPKQDIEREGRATVEKLKELLPSQQFAQAVQASYGGRIIARETIPALKKDVTGYLYGGDRTRKMKLWKKQQKGKKKLKELASQGNIKVPANVFKELLKK